MDPKEFDISAFLEAMKKKVDHSVDDYGYEEEERFVHPFFDEVDLEILRHREAHFGGSFQVMIDYYGNEGKGLVEEFSIRRLEELQQLEEEQGENIAGQLLNSEDFEKISNVKEKYAQLQLLAERKGKENLLPRLMAELILSPSVEADEEREAILAQGEDAIPFLLNLLEAEPFYDPLYPGFGQAPSLAALCLGRLGSAKAVIPLFERIGRYEFFIESQLIHALTLIGRSAKDFLLRIAKSRPVTSDNEKACIALAAFKGDADIVDFFIAAVSDPEMWKHETLVIYCILGCEGVANPQQREQLRQLLAHPDFPRACREELKALISTWKP